MFGSSINDGEISSLNPTQLLTFIKALKLEDEPTHCNIYNLLQSIFKSMQERFLPCLLFGRVCVKVFFVVVIPELFFLSLC